MARGAEVSARKIDTTHFAGRFLSSRHLFRCMCTLVGHARPGIVPSSGSEDEWDLREGCSVQSGACVGGI